MKKTLSIHLGRQLFVIEEDAFDRLQQYLQRLEASLQGETGTAEIIEDIEMRFAELLAGYLGETRKVVTIADVEKGIASLGEPEVISEDTPRDETQQQQQRPNSQQSGGQRRFFRDPERGILGGVCSGIAAYLNLDPVIVRVIFVILFFAGLSGGFIYIILWAIIPNASTPSERLQMHGKAVTIDALKDEIGKATDRIKDDTLRARDRFRSQNDHILQRGKDIGRIFLKLFGIALVGFASLGLIFFTLTVTGIIDFIPTTGDEEYTSAHDFLHIAIPNAQTFGLMWAAILLTGFGGLLMAITFGSRLIAGKSNTPLKITFIVLSAVVGAGFICGAISGAQTVRDFAVYEQFSQQQLTTNAASLTVTELPHYAGNSRILSSGGVDFVRIKNGRITEHGVTITYHASKDSLFHITQAFTTHGVDSEAVRRRCRHMRHVVQLIGDKLVIDPYYSFPAKDGFRDQEVEVIIEVPKDKKLKINDWEVINPDSEHSGSFFANEPFEAWEW